MAIFIMPDRSEADPTQPLGTSTNPCFKVWTVANVLTMLRMALTLVFLILFVKDTNRVAALVVYGIAASTDWLDGQVARRTQTVSWFGKILDPICDRVLLFTGVLGLVLRGELPWWIAILLIGRDVYLALGAKIVQKYRRRPIDVVYTGKIATAFLMFGFTWMLLGQPVIEGFGWIDASWLPLINTQPGPAGLILVYMGCIFSLITAGIYTKIGISIKRSATEN